MTASAYATMASGVQHVNMSALAEPAIRALATASAIPQLGFAHCYDSISQDSENCTTCDEGRFGTDCSVAESSVTEDSNGMRYAAAFGPGHFTTFDGSSFTYRREGEHYLMIGSINLQIRLVPCKRGVYATCINAVGFSSGSGEHVVIHGGYTDDDLEYHVWVNGIVTNINYASSIGNNYFHHPHFI